MPPTQPDPADRNSPSDRLVHLTEFGLVVPQSKVTADYSASHLSPHTAQLVRGIMAQPADFGARYIKEACEYVAKELRDHGGPVRSESMQFAERSAEEPLARLYEVRTDRSLYDADVVVVFDLKQLGLKWEPYSNLGGLEFEQLERLQPHCPYTGRAEVGLLVAGGQSITLLSSAFSGREISLSAPNHQNRCGRPVLHTAHDNSSNGGVGTSEVFVKWQTDEFSETSARLSEGERKLLESTASSAESYTVTIERNPTRFGSRVTIYNEGPASFWLRATRKS